MEISRTGHLLQESGASDAVPTAPMPLWLGALWLVAGGVAAQILAAVGGLVLARWVGPSGYGFYTAAFALSSVFAYAAPLGLDSIVPRQIARRPETTGTVAVSALGPVLAWLPLLVLLIGGTGFLLGYSQEFLRLLFLAAWITGLRGLVNLLRAVLRGKERMDQDAVVQVAEGGLVLVGMVIGLWLAPTVWNALRFTLLAEALALVLVGLWVGRALHLPRWDGALAWRMTAEALPLSLTFTLIGLGIRLDTLALSLFRPASEVGLYGAAVGVVMLTRSLSTMAAAFLPRLSNLAAWDPPSFIRVRDRVFRWMLAMGLGLGLFITLLAPFLIQVLYGPAYTEAVPALRVLGCMSAALFVNTGFWQVLIARRDHRAIVVSAGVALLASLLLAAILIPGWGAMGAAIVALSRETIQTALLARPAMRS